MASTDYVLRFFHKGTFTKSKYVGGTCKVILEYVDADRFSYTVLMEYVLDVLKYKEIGGVYVKKVPSGWHLIQSDADLTAFLSKVEGERLDFYVDDVVDQSVEAKQQVQPHVVVRPRTQFFEGNRFSC